MIRNVTSSELATPNCYYSTIYRVQWYNIKYNTYSTMVYIYSTIYVVQYIYIVQYISLSNTQSMLEAENHVPAKHAEAEFEIRGCL